MVSNSYKFTYKLLLIILIVFLLIFVSYLWINHPLVEKEIILKNINLNIPGKNNKITLSGDTKK